MNLFTLLGTLMDHTLDCGGANDSANKVGEAVCYDIFNQDMIAGCAEWFIEPNSPHHGDKWEVVTIRIEKNKDDRYEISNILFEDEGGGLMKIPVADKVLARVSCTGYESLYYEICEELAMIL